MVANNAQLRPRFEAVIVGLVHGGPGLRAFILEAQMH
jgi:hypothetical protein